MSFSTCGACPARVSQGFRKAAKAELRADGTDGSDGFPVEVLQQVVITRGVPRKLLGIFGMEGESDVAPWNALECLGCCIDPLNSEGLDTATAHGYCIYCIWSVILRGPWLTPCIDICM